MKREHRNGIGSRGKNGCVILCYVTLRMHQEINDTRHGIGVGGISLILMTLIYELISTHLPTNLGEGRIDSS